MSTGSEKRKARKYIKNVISSVDEKTLLEASSVIERKVLEYVAERNFRNVFCYMSMEKEIVTDGIISGLSDLGVNIFVPRVGISGINAVQIYRGTVFEKGILGIREPQSREVYQGKMDAAIIPGLAYDRNLNRLGRGMGYYDRWLSKNDCLKVGIFGSWQELDMVPNNQYDVVLDCVFTEKSTISSLQ